MKRPSPWRLRAQGAAARLIPALRQSDLGAGGHDVYFAALAGALARAGVAQPTLVIDLARLDANIAVVCAALAKPGLALRAVSKSLQAPALLERVLSAAASEKVMAFNSVMLEDILAWRPGADVLLGRPLPAAAVDAFLRRHAGEDAPAARPHWLVDTPRRLTQYADVARARGARLRIALEVDVGLRRGGLADPAALAAAIDLARAEPSIEITGLMGYDAHLGASGTSAAAGRARAAYGAFAAVLRAKVGGDLILDTAGSLTWPLHLAGSAANEAAIGSAFLMPAHYDTAANARLQPALFMAQPVLKVVEPALIPGLEDQAADIAAADPNAGRGYFLYGGYGDARVVSPRGLAFSRLWGGRSLLVGSRQVALEADDFVFLRPTESEGELLRFGDLAVFDGENITAWWPTFSIAA
jgi:D-serine deaminase-like pyridoxal phosphate-dependent protein